MVKPDPDKISRSGYNLEEISNVKAPMTNEIPKSKPAGSLIRQLA
jgi:hypothetical protein